MRWRFGGAFALCLPTAAHETIPAGMTRPERRLGLESRPALILGEAVATGHLGKHLPNGFIVYFPVGHDK